MYRSTSWTTKVMQSVKRRNQELWQAALVPSHLNSRYSRRRLLWQYIVSIEVQIIPLSKAPHLVTSSSIFLGCAVHWLTPKVASSSKVKCRFLIAMTQVTSKSQFYSHKYTINGVWIILTEQLPRLTEAVNVERTCRWWGPIRGRQEHEGQYRCWALIRGGCDC